MILNGYAFILLNLSVYIYIHTLHYIALHYITFTFTFAFAITFTCTFTLHTYIHICVHTCFYIEYILYMYNTYVIMHIMHSSFLLFSSED